MKLHVGLAVGLAIGLIVSTFAQQEEPSLSEQDGAQVLAGREGIRKDSPALKPINQTALQAAVAATAAEMLVPGALVILSTPQGMFTVSHGTTTLGATIPPRAGTHFRIASNTKTMTAAVIVQLAQEGRLDLGDPVSKYVAGVPNGDQIAIADLLKMRSGLYNYTDAPEVSASLDRDPTKVWTPDEVLAIAFKHPPYFPPGTAFHYSTPTTRCLASLPRSANTESRWRRSFKTACSDHWA